MLVAVRLFRGALPFFAPLSAVSWISELAFLVESVFDAILVTFDFELAGSLWQWEAEAADFFVALGSFLVATSAIFGVGKNRERDGGLNSAEGDGRNGGDAPRGEASRSFPGFRNGLVGVLKGGMGEEDSTITSLELAIVASVAFRIGGGQDRRAALET